VAHVHAEPLGFVDHGARDVLVPELAQQAQTSVKAALFVEPSTLVHVVESCSHGILKHHSPPFGRVRQCNAQMTTSTEIATAANGARTSPRRAASKISAIVAAAAPKFAPLNQAAFLSSGICDPLRQLGRVDLHDRARLRPQTRQDCPCRRHG
jgi:hypothetical protein